MWATDCRHDHRKVQHCSWELPHAEVPWYSPWGFEDQHLEAHRGRTPTWTVYRRYRGHMRSCLPGGARTAIRTWRCGSSGMVGSRGGRARMTKGTRTLLYVVLAVVAVMIVLWVLFTQGLEARVT